MIIPSRHEATHARQIEMEKTKKDILNQIQDQDGVTLEEHELDWDIYRFGVNEIDFQVSIYQDSVVVDNNILDKLFRINQNINLETDFEDGQWFGESEFLPLGFEPLTKWINIMH